MMVDVHHTVALQIGQLRSIQVVTFQDEQSIIITFYSIRDSNRFDLRQEIIAVGMRVCIENMSGLSQFFQGRSQAQGGSDRVSIGTRMRCDGKTSVCLDEVYYVVQSYSVIVENFNVVTYKVVSEDPFRLSNKLFRQCFQLFSVRTNRDCS